MAKYIGLSLSEEDYKKLLQFKENEKSLAEIVRKTLGMAEFTLWMKKEKSDEYYRYLAEFLKYKDTAQQQVPQKTSKNTSEKVKKERKRKEVERVQVGGGEEGLNDEKIDVYKKIFEGMKEFDPSDKLLYEVIKSSLSAFGYLEFSEEEAIKAAEILVQQKILEKKDGKFVWVGEKKE